MPLLLATLIFIPPGTIHLPIGVHLCGAVHAFERNASFPSRAPFGVLGFPSGPVVSQVYLPFRFDRNSLVLHERYDVIFYTDKHLLRLRLHLSSPASARNQWMRQLRKYFDLLDRDADGYLNAYEVGFALPVGGVREAMQMGFAYAAPDEPDRTLEMFDRDADRRVSFEEFAAYYLTAIQSSIMLRSLSTADDALAKSNDSLFKRFDTNKDGRLSRAELSSLEHFLDKLDRNEDECLSLSEINSKPEVLDPDAAPEAKQPAVAVPEMLKVYRAGEIPDAEIEAMLKRYDANGDGQLQRSESPFSPEVFARLDKDGNGILTRAELLAWKTIPADAELDLIPDQHSARVREGAGRLTAMGVQVDTLADGRLLIRMNGRSLDVGCASEEATLSSPRATPFRFNEPNLQEDESTILALFDKAVRGKTYLTDGDLAGYEYQSLRILFDVLDRDGDGRLTRAECARYVQVLGGFHALSSKLGFATRSPDLFGLIDRDGDRRLSRRELRNAWSRLKHLEPSGGEYLTRDAVQPMGMIRFGRGSNPAVGDPGIPKPPGVKVPEWFTKLDRNHDGDLSRSEFPGRPEDFDRIDLDGDGLISPAEAQAADEKFRKPGP